ncbi:MAG: hypothetical protein KTR32_29755 [Granulosicoccus sp.]|nr:hypothetical protein [Granulosicoccus sp.]
MANADSHIPIDPQPVIHVNQGDDIFAAVQRINAAGQGTLVWGEGIFRIPAATSQYTVLNFSHLSAFKMYGQGTSATRLMQDIDPDKAVGQLRLCALDNVASFDISNFSIDGQNARYELPDSPSIGENAHWKSRGQNLYALHNNREAMSSFFVRKVRNGRFRHLNNISARGDFINMADAFGIVVYGCDIADCGRNGITLGGQRGLEWSHDVEIDSCVFRSTIDTQMIDLELHGLGTATRSQLNRNVHVHHCEFEAHSPDDVLDMDQFAIVMNEVLGFTIDHCSILGPVIVRNAEGRMHDNTGGIPQFTMDRDSTVDIRRTKFELTSKMRDANRMLASIFVARRDDISPRQFTLVDCDIVVADNVAVAIEIRNCHDVLVADNRVELSEATTGIYLHADAHGMSGRIQNNTGLGTPVINEKNGRRVSVVTH